MDTYFARNAVLRQGLWECGDHSTKVFEVTSAALPRYFLAHSESGCKSIRILLDSLEERDLTNGLHHVDTKRMALIYHYENDHRVSVP